MACGPPVLDACRHEERCTVVQPGGRWWDLGTEGGFCIFFMRFAWCSRDLGAGRGDFELLEAFSGGSGWSAGLFHRRQLHDTLQVALRGLLPGALSGAGLRVPTETVLEVICYRFRGKKGRFEAERHLKRLFRDFGPKAAGEQHGLDSAALPGARQLPPEVCRPRHRAGRPSSIDRYYTSCLTPVFEGEYRKISFYSSKYMGNQYTYYSSKIGVF